MSVSLGVSRFGTEGVALDTDHAEVHSLIETQVARVRGGGRDDQPARAPGLAAAHGLFDQGSTHAMPSARVDHRHALELDDTVGPGVHELQVADDRAAVDSREDLAIEKVAVESPVQSHRPCGTAAAASPGLRRTRRLSLWPCVNARTCLRVASASIRDGDQLSLFTV